MGNIAYDKSFEYALEIMKLTKELKSKQEYEVAKQLLRSGTSIGANISESEYAQGKADFVSKLSIALKEANESRYWLKLLSATKEIDEEKAKALIVKAEEIIRILTASIKTSKNRS